ncbi:MAG TPA: NapC/NirT family cytochrome c [Planctomycetota bacterium]|nr:NapC/NirT family cytochrome c [Planctomycetota bacterium]
MTGRILRRALAVFAIALAALVSVGGGGTFVMMEVTTKPQFCRSCHIMEPYVDSWATSSHKNVTCVDCHYEPGLLETFEGKFKALSQLAKYVTQTQGTKPWAEVSDYSCMRGGCHSERLLEGEIQFGRIRFDHKSHLIGSERGKKLRCTSCHSQIVQGNHLTVTTTSCFLCHFKPGPTAAGGPALGDCNLCHGPPPDAIQLGPFSFRHSDYLSRGVQCSSCHGDVTRGMGEVPRDRCGSCHNKEAHLQKYDDVEFVHRMHVTEHSVSCIRCHNEIQHGLPPREEHYKGACSNCHVDTHKGPAEIYRGTGGKDVADDPSAMYLARVTCNGCHRPPFPGAPSPPATYEADLLACVDCHGTGFTGMAERWQKEADVSLAKAKDALGKLEEAMGEEREEGEGDPAAAKSHYEAAAWNVSLALSDGSRGVHNLPYLRDLLRKASEEIKGGFEALEERAPSVPIGPFVASQQGCTNLCHVGVEERRVDRARDLPFAHATHLLKAKLDCSKCHAAEPHGTTVVQRQDCVSCHHGSEKAETCAACHGGVARLRAADKAPMADLDCIACHADFSPKKPLRERMMAACDECHEDDEKDFSRKHYDEWISSADAALAAADAAVAGLPADAAAGAREKLAALRASKPFHNPAAAKAEAEGIAK